MVYAHDYWNVCFFPYISNIIQKFSFNEILIPIILIFLGIFVLPSLKDVSIFLNYTNLQFSSIIDMTWAGGTYGIYIILGYYVWNKGILRKIKMRYIVFCTIIFYLSCIGFQMLSYIVKSTIILNCDFVGLLLCSVCLFEFIRRLKIIRYQEILKKFQCIP